MKGVMQTIKGDMTGIHWSITNVTKIFFRKRGTQRIFYNVIVFRAAIYILTFLYVMLHDG